MANNKSALKRVKITAVKTARNRKIKSVIKTSIKRFYEALASGDKEQAQAAFVKAQKTIDKGVTKGVIHKNNAARKKSRLAKKFDTA
ncbi:MAG TPA: 30S ribosomal protein S20 [Firmicutes bacterium]|nr:30S ribosomal protein S20 [Bacillota bacterium]